MRCLESGCERAGIGVYDFSRKFAHGIKLDRDFIFLLRRCGRRRNADRRFVAVPSPSSSVPPFIRSLSPVENREVAPSFRGPAPLAASLTAAAASKPAPTPRLAAPLLLRALYPPLFALTHSLYLSRSLLSRSGLPSIPPASKVGGRPLVIRNMPIKVIWTPRLLFPSLQTADNNHQPPRAGSERQRKGCVDRQDLCSPPRDSGVLPSLADTFPNMKYPPPARCRARAGGAVAPHVSFVRGGGVGKGAYY